MLTYRLMHTTICNSHTCTFQALRRKIINNFYFCYIIQLSKNTIPVNNLCGGKQLTMLSRLNAPKLNVRRCFDVKCHLCVERHLKCFLEQCHCFVLKFDIPAPDEKRIVYGNIDFCFRDPQIVPFSFFNGTKFQPKHSTNRV